MIIFSMHAYISRFTFNLILHIRIWIKIEMNFVIKKQKSLKKEMFWKLNFLIPNDQTLSFYMVP